MFCHVIFIILLLLPLLEGETVTLEQAIAQSMEGAAGDIAVVETRWSRAFKYIGNMAKITGIMASFAGAIATGLQLFRDIKKGAPPAQIAFEAIEVCSLLCVCNFSSELIVFI